MAKKLLVKKYSWGGFLAQVTNPNVWGQNGAAEGASGVAGGLINAVGGTQGLSQMFGGINQIVQPGTGTGKGSAIGSVAADIGTKVAGIFGKSNPFSAVAGTASDLGVGLLGKAFGKDTNYSDAASNIVNKASNVLNAFGPIGMAASFAIKAANMLGSKKVEGVEHNEYSQKQLGGAYGLSQYDRDTKNFGLFGRGQANKYEDEVNKMKGILSRADDVANDTRIAELRRQGSAEGITSKNQIDESGGFKSFKVKKGGSLYNIEFANRCLDIINNKYKNGGTIVKPSKNMSKRDFFKYIESTGRMSNDYDYDKFYDDKELFYEWIDNELKNPTQAHFYDKYKKPNHITFSEESIYSNGDIKGGRWLEEDGKMYFIPTKINIDNAGGFDGLNKYFEENEPDVILSYPDDDTLYMKNGGQFNVIPSGSLHKERHHLEDVSELMKGRVSKKGIPVITIDKDGNVKQHAEIERNEIIFRKETTDKLIELMNSDDDDSDFKAGDLLVDEIFNKTVDNTGLIKSIKV